jgi:hypothetical protein
MSRIWADVREALWIVHVLYFFDQLFVDLVRYITLRALLLHQGAQSYDPSVTKVFGRILASRPLV